MTTAKSQVQEHNVGKESCLRNDAVEKQRQEMAAAAEMPGKQKRKKKSDGKADTEIPKTLVKFS